MKGLHYKFGVFFLLAFTSLFTMAQGDVHFSQFNRTPMHINPAATGVFFGGVRATSNYRSQWGFTGVPFVTLGFTADGTVLNDLTNNDYLAVGISATQDAFGDGISVANQINGSFAYGRAIDPYEEHYFSIGFQGGYVLNQADFTQFIWENQWETTGFNTSLPSREPAAFENFNFLDFAAGIHYFYNNHSTLKIYGGAAMYHINRPEINYYSQLEQLFRRLNFHAAAEITGENTTATLIPQAFLSIQGPNRLFVFGNEFSFRLQEASQTVGRIKEINFSLGPFVRWNDGAYVVSRVEWGGFSAGVSYDFNLSGLFQASRGLGGPEIMLSYISAPFENYDLKRGKNRFE